MELLNFTKYRVFDKLKVKLNMTLFLFTFPYNRKNRKITVT